MPNQLAFYEHGTKKRLYFIGVPQGKKENTLMFVEVTADGNTLPWKPVLNIPEQEENDVILSKVNFNLT